MDQGGQAKLKCGRTERVLQQTGHHHYALKAGRFIAPTGGNMHHDVTGQRPAEWLPFALITLGPDVLGQPHHGCFQHGFIGSFAIELKPVVAGSGQGLVEGITFKLGQQFNRRLLHRLAGLQALFQLLRLASYKAR